MELRQWAIELLSANTLDKKLFTPVALTDHNPGIPLFWSTPERPYGMHFQKRSHQEKLPSLQTLEDPQKRAQCLHRFAGHELLAIEIMAYALLAFPEAPSTFRKGIAHTLKDEQRHLALYIKRLKDLGVSFGTFPLYKHFWAHVKFLKNPIEYVSTMNLTFEMANLDFAPMYGKAFEKVEDHASKELMQIILNDEIQHVRFGWQWLKKFKPEALDMWEAWKTSQAPLLFPKRAKGKNFQETPRLKAGIPSPWIQQLKNQ